MDIYDFTDYRAVIRKRLSLLPKNGYGELGKIAKTLTVSSALISQILSGTKNLTEDQGYRLAEYFKFNESETIYFLLLVQRERVGDQKLKKLFEKQIAQAQKNAQKLKNRITVETELTFEQQAVFYSDWLYTAIHALTSIKAMNSVDTIADRLGISRPKVVEVVNWLLQFGLCKEEHGKLVIGPMTTFVEKNSALFSRHHSNWRQKGMEAVSDPRERDFFFTAPFTISKTDYDQVRKELVQFIDGMSKRVAKSPPQVLAAINIDYFEVT